MTPFVCTALAMLAFAGNSLLTRLALGAGDIPAATFTMVRLAAGAAVLALLAWRRSGGWTYLRPPPVAGAISLFAYAAPFSFAYLRIGAAVGALVLFAAVQLTMIGWGVARGDRPPARTWLGLAAAAGGLVWSMLPRVTRPDLLGVLLMITAGVAWGVYSLLGRKAGDPLVSNARAFVYATPLAVLVNVATAAPAGSARGLTLALLSGAITSGLGYAIWYRAVPHLGAVRAAVIQLSVPVIAGAGAILWLDERPTTRFLVAGAVVIGGVGLAVGRRR